MSKLLAIGLIAAASLGFVTLPSNDDSQTAPVTAMDITTPAIAAVSKSVAGPFELSAQRCASEQYHCVARIEDSTIQEMIPRHRSWEEILAFNGWNDSEVSPETVVPAGTWIAFGMKQT